jgi:hypothetical protein
MYNPTTSKARSQPVVKSRKNICIACFVFTIFSTPLLVLLTMPLAIANYAYIVKSELLLGANTIAFLMPNTLNETGNQTSLYDDCRTIFDNFVVPSNKATLYLPTAFYLLIIGFRIFYLEFL